MPKKAKIDYAVAGPMNVSLSEQAAHVLGYTGGHPSMRINEVVLRYSEIVRKRRSEVLYGFSEDELSALSHAVGRGGVVPVGEVSQYLARLVSNSAGVMEEWGVDTGDLMRRVSELDYIPAVVLVEIVTQEEYWSVREKRPAGGVDE